MLDHNIVFDYDNHLVGFADGACDNHADSTEEADGDSAGAKVCTRISVVPVCACVRLRVFRACFVGCVVFVVMPFVNTKSGFYSCLAFLKIKVSHSAIVTNAAHGHWANEVLSSYQDTFYVVAQRPIDEFPKTAVDTCAPPCRRSPPPTDSSWAHTWTKRSEQWNGYRSGSQTVNQ